VSVVVGLKPMNLRFLVDGLADSVTVSVLSNLKLYWHFLFKESILIQALPKIFEKLERISQFFAKILKKVLMNFLQTFLPNSYEFLANISLNSYKFLTNFLHEFYEIVTNFLQTSYKLLMNFIQTSYDLYTNFI
jgi:hypothetical protein